MRVIVKKSGEDEPDFVAQAAHDRVEQVYKLLKEELSDCQGEYGNVIQQELAFLLSILPLVAKTNNSYLIDQAEIAAKALLSEQQNLLLVYEINRNLKAGAYKIRRPVRHYFMSMVGPVRLVLFGVIMSIFIMSIFALYWAGRMESSLFFADPDKLLFYKKVAIAASTGGVVSIAMRLNTFSRMVYAKGSELFFTGFFKPLVACVFGIFVCFLIDSEVLPITVSPTDKDAFFMAVAFLVGFSERLANDILGRAEGVLLPKKEV